MRSRNIKPGFYKNEQLAECSFAARLLFPGLWMIADRSGRMEYRPKRIKAELFPFDNLDITELIGELEREGLVVKYSNERCSYLWIPGFSKHQAPHIKEKPSELPPCPLESTVLAPCEHDTSTVLAPCEHPLIPDSLNLIPDSLIPEKDIVPSVKNKKFTPPSLDQVKAYCKDRGSSVSPETFFERNTAGGWMVGKVKMKDWKAAVRYWESNEISRNGKRQPMKTARQQYMQELGDALEAADGTETRGSATGLVETHQPLPGVGPQRKDCLQVGS